MQFYRQKPLLDYIVDFYCPRAHLVVEIDGKQHLEADVFADDRLRDAGLASIGLRVLRFNNIEVLGDTDAVILVIASAIQGLKI